MGWNGCIYGRGIYATTGRFDGGGATPTG